MWPDIVCSGGASVVFGTGLALVPPLKFKNQIFPLDNLVVGWLHPWRMLKPSPTWSSSSSDSSMTRRRLAADIAKAVSLFADIAKGARQLLISNYR